MKQLLAVVVAFVVMASAAWAASAHYVKVTPSTATAGSTVKVSGKVTGCSTAEIYSSAFNAKPGAGNLPTVNAKVSGGSFSAKAKLKSTLKAGKYHVGGRCGGGNFGSATLTVSKVVSGY